MVASNTDSNVAIATAQQSIPPIPVPSLSWCRWQAFKGTNSRRLTIPDVDLRNKWIVLTGGNSGVGLETALQFAKWGANIILGCRQQVPSHEMHPDDAVQMLKDAALAAGHGKVAIEWWECDMSSLKSVEDFGKSWLSTGRSLDILVNNAGIGGTPVSGETVYTADDFEIVHQVNFISHVLLTMILLPSLAHASQPRIICTTSCMQYFGVFDLENTNSARNAYPNNKLYFQTWLTELQARMEKHDKYKHIKIQGVHPGYVKTNIWVPLQKDSAQKVSPQGVAPMSWLAWGLKVLLRYVGIDAQQGSLAITHAATVVEFGSGGRYYNRIWDATPMPQTRHPECRRQIWQFVGKELMLEDKGLLTELGV